MTNFEKCEYWLELADDDLITAKWLLKGNRLLYCSYACHQIIEKAFKAAITKNTGEIPPKIHDLPKLADKGLLYGLLSEEQLLTLDKLKPMQIEGRYPEYKNEIFQKLTPEYCERIIEETESLLCWIKKQLEK
jgi:HEPN domain-containing protein